MPYGLKRFIGNVREDDEFVQVVGKVVKVLGKTKFTIEDKTGKIDCEPIPDDCPKLSEKLIVKVYGWVRLDDDVKTYLEPIVVQDKTGLDLDMYYKTLEMFIKIAYK